MVARRLSGVAGPAERARGSGAVLPAALARLSGMLLLRGGGDGVCGVRARLPDHVYKCEGRADEEEH